MGTFMPVISCDCSKKKTREQDSTPVQLKPIHQGIHDNINMNSSSTNESIINKKVNISPKDFQIIKMIGQGSSGTVFLVQNKKSPSKELCAMKIINKNLLYPKSQVQNILNELNILKNIHHPFLISLKKSFQDKTCLYFITDYMVNGDLFQLIRYSNFTETEISFVLCELILALDHLHTHNYIYRDLKPENILIDEDGHIKLTDFGLCKHINDNERTFTICGTLNYIAPEILKKKGYNHMVDYWSMGILIYEMLSGKNPWEGKEFFLEMYKNPIKLYKNFSEEVIDLIGKLLVMNPEKRIGSKGVDEIKRHKFFIGVDWEDVYNKKGKSPLKEKLKCDKNTKFDKQNETRESTIKDNSEFTFHVNDFTYDAEEE